MRLAGIDIKGWEVFFSGARRHRFAASSGTEGDSAAEAPDYVEGFGAIILGIEVGLLALSSWRSAVYEHTLLTDIECKVLDCAAEGMTVDQTAGLRGVSRGTIMTRRRSVLRKLGARNMAEAVATGYELGLLERS